MRPLFLTLFLASCATTGALTPVQQCAQRVCPEAARTQEVGPGGSASYDDFDDTCLCVFRNGQTYITPRR